MLQGVSELIDSRRDVFQEVSCGWRGPESAKRTQGLG